ncbi:DUF58 domain-containing protein [Marinobacterium mangrovicola]|uniref:Uncharacterized protein (DUF58 family) n=1 Tax=Marinobacterium mangrovicola TaxID=1476959 RepID=A0A4R1GD94_9GAMM|nr:DUF58 domain-containing protein [Marinobacterium mangrovicola]TCK04823.1 uncharacterized protein (DUF58 family) [Marinobacterium mangrovicola]
MRFLALNLLPDRGLFKYLLIFLGLGLGLALLRVLSTVAPSWPAYLWWGLFLLAAVAAALDALALYTGRMPYAGRQLPGNLALGSPATIRLRFENPGRRGLRLEYTDHYPAALSCEQLPAQLDLPADTSLIVEYQVRPVQRGDAHFGAIELRVQSPLGLWRRQLHIEAEQSVKVYPNFMALSGMDFLDNEQRVAHLGAHLTQRRGSGLEFRQLREYQRGDEIRQIDWKATARQQKLISREYQDERDQEVLFMLDTGRRMRALDGELSHFDHSLNALLLTAYMALGMGDSVGVLGFAGSNRWVSPVKGRQGINRLLNQLYDIQSSTEASDLSQAAEALMLKQQKRALVVIVSNMRDDDSEELQLAARILGRKHLVMVACLRESFLDRELEEEPGYQATLNHCARELYREQRADLIAQLKARGVMVVDSAPQQMHVALIQEYLALKRAGRI